MRKQRWKLTLLAGAVSVALLGGCAGAGTSETTAVQTTAAAETETETEAATEEETTRAEESTEAAEETEGGSQSEDGPLVIADQGIFSAGGITMTSEGTFNPEDHWEETGAGQTAHVDHANVL